MNSVTLASLMHRLSPLLFWARLLFTPLSLLVIAWLIWESRNSLAEILVEGNWVMLVSALFLWITTNFASPLVATFLFKSCGMQIDYRRALDIHCNRLPAKYLPGGIWHSVGRANDYLKIGLAPKKIGIYFILENFLLIAVTLCLSAGIVEHLIEIPFLQSVVYFLPSFTALALCVFPFALQFFLKQNQTFSISAYFMALLLMFAYWSVVGMAFAFYISAFDALGLTRPLFEMAGIYIFSWSLGYLAIFAPQGIGISEFIAGALLTESQLAGHLLAFLLGFRVLVLVGDLISWAISSIRRASRAELIKVSN